MGLVHEAVFKGDWQVRDGWGRTEDHGDDTIHPQGRNSTHRSHGTSAMVPILGVGILHDGALLCTTLASLRPSRWV